MYIKYMMSVSHDVEDLSSCKIDQAARYHVPDEPMLPFTQIITLQQKHPHHVLDVHDAKSLQQFLQCVSGFRVEKE